MIMNRTKLLLASTAVQLALVLPGVALAQTQPTPPERYTLDPNGVDLVSGGFVYAAQEVGIGPGDGGLGYGRTYLKSAQGISGWRDLSIGTIKESGSTYIVGLGSKSEVFTKSGSTFTPQSNTGAKLVQSGSTFTYTASDGSIAIFGRLPTDSFWRVQNDHYYGSDIIMGSYIRPNALRTDYHFEPFTHCVFYDYNLGECTQYGAFVRLTAVDNNQGYRLNYHYVSNDPDAGGTGQAFLTVSRVTASNLAQPSVADSPKVQYGFTSNGYGAVLSGTDQSGRTTNYLYDGMGYLSGVQHPGQTAADFTVTYNGQGRVASHTGPAGVWNYTYLDSGSSRTTTATGPLGQQLVVMADLSIGRATSVSQTTSPGVSRTWTYGYDSQRRLQRVTNPEGDYAEVTYDARGNVTQTRSAGKTGSAVTDIVTSAAYPASCSNAVTCNLPESTTDARGYTTHYTYDPNHGGVLTVTAPAPSSGAGRPQTRISYAAQTAYYSSDPYYIFPHSGGIAAAPTSVTLPVQISACATGSSCIGTADEVRTTLTYGSAGVANNLNPTVVSEGSGANPSMAVTTTTWTTNGDVATADGPLAGADDTARYIYDDGRQNVGVIGPDPDGGGPLQNRAQRMTYSPRGQVTLTETGTTAGQSDGAWSAFSPIVRTATTYDAQGRPLETRAQSGAGVTAGVEQVSYDAAGRPSCTVTRMNPATFSSLPSSACTAATTGADGPDRITQIAYDYAGRPTHVTTAAGLTEAVTQVTAYTVSGQVASLTDGNGNVSIVEYDGHDRKVKLRYPSSSSAGTTSTTDYEAVGYDAGGNVTTQMNRAGQATYVSYDNLSRPILIDAPSGTMDVAITYDNLGRVLSSIGNSQTLINVWDPLSRLTSETGPLGTTAYQHDAAGRMTRITWPDAFYAQYDHDTTGAVTAIRENGAGSGAGVLATYTYTSLGQPNTIARGNGIGTSYGYDAHGRMSSLSHGGSANVTFSYGYNAAGQIASRTVSNPAYVLAPGAGTTSYGNDGLNRVTSVAGTGVGYDSNHNISSALGNSYGYDAANRLTTATIGGTGYGFDYDPGGRLYSAGGGYFQYVGAQLAGEYNSSGAMTTRHVPGPGLDQPVATLFGGARFQQIADERGSVVGVADASGVVNINRYDEYGVPSAGNRFQYTGQAWIAPGLYNYRARAYAPQLGRFLQTDPSSYGAGMNLYGYVGGDPVNFVDPFGLDRILVRVCGSGRTVGGGPGSPVDGSTITVTAPSCHNQWVDFGGRPDFGAGVLGGGGRQPIVEPDGVSTQQLICQAARLPGNRPNSVIPNGDDPGNFAGYAAGGLDWFNLVKPGGAWDFKTRSRVYEGYGNFAYGATGYALGLPESVLLRGAGWAQERYNSPGRGYDPAWGNFRGRPPYGDDPRDQESIRQGIQYAKDHPCPQK